MCVLFFNPHTRFTKQAITLFNRINPTRNERRTYEMSNGIEQLCNIHDKYYTQGICGNRTHINHYAYNCLVHLRNLYKENLMKIRSLSSERKIIFDSVWNTHKIVFVSSICIILLRI